MPNEIRALLLRRSEDYFLWTLSRILRSFSVTRQLDPYIQLSMLEDGEGFSHIPVSYLLAQGSIPRQAGQGRVQF